MDCCFSGGRQENLDWFDNDGKFDRIIFESYNYSDQFMPTDENIDDVKMGKKVMLLSRVYFLSKRIRGIFAMPGSVLSNPIEMVAERGTHTFIEIYANR